MKIIITERQYNKIFLSGKFDNLIIESSIPSKVIDDLITKLGTIFTKTTKFEDKVGSSLRQELKTVFGYANKINNITEFERFLQTLKNNSTIQKDGLNIAQFKTLYKIPIDDVKIILNQSLSNDKKINELLVLWKRADEVNNSKVKSRIESELNNYFENANEMDSFIQQSTKDIKGVDKISDITKGGDFGDLKQELLNVLNKQEKLNEMPSDSTLSNSV